MLKRASIRDKLIGIVGGLLFIMVVASTYSFYRSYDMHERSGDHADHILPIVIEVTTLQNLMLKQEVELERALRLTHYGASAVGKLAMARTSYRQYHKDILGVVDQVRRMTAESISRMAERDDAVGMQEVRTYLEVLTRNHDKYLSLALSNVFPETKTFVP